MGNLQPFTGELLENMNTHHLLLKVKPMIVRGLLILKESYESVLLIGICKHSFVFSSGRRLAAGSLEQAAI